MSDQRLRELERRWAESRSDADHLALLHERIRVGDQLDWAAYCNLVTLDAPAATDYIGRLVQVGSLDRARVELAASVGEPGARAYCLEREAGSRRLVSDTAFRDQTDRIYMQLLRLLSEDPVRELGNSFRNRECARDDVLDLLGERDWRDTLVGLLGVLATQATDATCLEALWNRAPTSWVAPQCAVVAYLVDPEFKSKAEALLVSPPDPTQVKFLNALLALYRAAWPEEPVRAALAQLPTTDRDRGDRIAMGWLLYVRKKRRFLEPLAAGSPVR